VWRSRRTRRNWKEGKRLEEQLAMLRLLFQSWVQRSLGFASFKLKLRIIIPIAALLPQPLTQTKVLLKHQGPLILKMIVTLQRE
jgi:hypothetical protein